LLLLISELDTEEKTDVVVTKPSHLLLTLTSDRVLQRGEGRDWKESRRRREVEGGRGKVLNDYAAGGGSEMKVQASHCFGVHD
jgi:hypothetical protein